VEEKPQQHRQAGMLIAVVHAPPESKVMNVQVPVVGFNLGTLDTVVNPL